MNHQNMIKHSSSFLATVCKVILHIELIVVIFVNEGVRTQPHFPDWLWCESVLCTHHHDWISSEDVGQDDRFKVEHSNTGRIFLYSSVKFCKTQMEIHRTMKLNLLSVKAELQKDFYSRWKISWNTVNRGKEETIVNKGYISSCLNFIIPKLIRINSKLHYPSNHMMFLSF